MDRMGLPSQYAHYSRRAFFGIAAAATAVGAAACDAAARAVGGKASPGKAHDQALGAKARGPVRENDLPGDPHWNIRHLGAPDAIVGYAGQASVLPGEPVTLYVSTTARSFRVSAFRMGWYKGDEARLLWKSGTVQGHRQRQPDLIQPTNTVDAKWDPSLTVPTDDWPEGSYLLRMDAENGAQRFVPVTVRSASTAGKTVIKNGVETWQAYNTWGGYDLYNGPGGVADYGNRSLAVSLDRPYDANGAYMFLYHERKTIELAERSGLPLAYVTSMDIDGDPHLLDGAHALFTGGHDEYWTPQERAHVTAARNAGTNIAFMGANTMFRRTRMASTRLGERRLVICYKTSYLQDPMYGKNNALVTSDWREPPVPDPESSLTGTLYESNPVTADFVVASPDSWIFAHTGVQKGTKLTGLVGIEYDRVNPVYPVERPIQVLSHSPLQCRGINSYSDSAYYTHRGGAGVFNTGTMRWVACSNGLRLFGLNRQAAEFTRQVAVNLLHAFAEARPRRGTRRTTTSTRCRNGPAIPSPASTTCGPPSCSEHTLPPEGVSRPPGRALPGWEESASRPPDSAVLPFRQGANRTMPNFNDARITSLYVNSDSGVHDIQDDAPNAPNGGKFDVTLEMVAGEGVLGDYTLTTTCTDLTDSAAATAALRPGAPLNVTAGHFQGAEWKKVPPAGPPAYWTFNHSVKVGPPGPSGHAYRYTAVLHNTNGQIVSVLESDPFVLL